MSVDATNADRVAQPLIVEVKPPYGVPPSYPDDWAPVWDALVERIEISPGPTPSTARIAMPNARWNARPPWMTKAGLVRICSNYWVSHTGLRTYIFEGVITAIDSSFSGGMGAGESFSPGHESMAVICLDYRWLTAVTSPLLGRCVRGPDDYATPGDYTSSPLADSYTWVSGRRIVFNESARPNRAAYRLNLPSHHVDYDCPIFSVADDQPWTAGEMIEYCVSPLHNRALRYMDLTSDGHLLGLEHEDFDTIINNVAVDGLNVIEGIALIARHIGWSFREEATNTGPRLAFYKPGSASPHARTTANTTTLHTLHAPAVSEAVNTAVAAGRKMLWSMALREDIGNIVNRPYAIGAPHRFEFTAELVPAWCDYDFAPDPGALFFTDADLQEYDAPNSLSYYRNYHVRGSNFLRNVARRWSLNETGRYTPTSTFNRGMPFDFAAVVPPEHILTGSHRMYAPFARQLLPVLTQDKDGVNSIGIVVEFSFDGGDTWQVLPGAISSLSDEAGIYIAEPNLCEMVDEGEGTICGGDLDGVQLNYFSSLADDKLNSRSFKNGDWRTRCRVTASIQLDHRLGRYITGSAACGSPFHQVKVHDFSSAYGLSLRTAASMFDGTDYPADELDSTDRIDEHLKALRLAHQDASLSGLFVLERLWLGDDPLGLPIFMPGDGIAGISGRAFNLTGRSSGRDVYPEIVKIIYLGPEQRQHLVTRDLRFTEITL